MQRSWKSRFWKSRFWKRPAPGFGKDQPQALEKTMPQGRGGPRRQPKPWIDAGLKKHQDLLKNLGSYEHLSSSSSPNPKALLDLQPLWSDLVALEPSGLIHPQPLRQAMLSLLAEVPSLNMGDHSGQVWCNLKVRRLYCMLTHCRKLQRDTSTLTVVAGKLTRLQYQTLTESLKRSKCSARRRKCLERHLQARRKCLEKHIQPTGSW